MQSKININIILIMVTIIVTLIWHTTNSISYIKFLEEQNTQLISQIIADYENYDDSFKTDKIITNFLD